MQFWNFKIVGFGMNKVIVFKSQYLERSGVLKNLKNDAWVRLELWICSTLNLLADKNEFVAKTKSVYWTAVVIGSVSNPFEATIFNV